MPLRDFPLFPSQAEPGNQRKSGLLWGSSTHGLGPGPTSCLDLCSSLQKQLHHFVGPVL